MSVKGCFLYFRPGKDLQIHSRKLSDSDVHTVYLYNTDGKVRAVRHAVETLVRSLHEWLDAPENGGLEADVFETGDVINARASRELEPLFADFAPTPIDNEVET